MAEFIFLLAIEGSSLNTERNYFKLPDREYDKNGLPGGGDTVYGSTFTATGSLSVATWVGNQGISGGSLSADTVDGLLYAENGTVSAGIGSASAGPGGSASVGTGSVGASRGGFGTLGSGTGATAQGGTVVAGSLSGALFVTGWAGGYRGTGIAASAGETAFVYDPGSYMAVGSAPVAAAFSGGFMAVGTVSGNQGGVSVGGTGGLGIVGSVNIVDGGVSAGEGGRLRIGTLHVVDGEIAVDGAGSVLSVAAGVSFGDADTTTLTVSGGGRFETAGTLDVGSVGTLSVTDKGSVLKAHELHLDPNAHVTIDKDATVILDTITDPQTDPNIFEKAGTLIVNASTSLFGTVLKIGEDATSVFKNVFRLKDHASVETKGTMIVYDIEVRGSATDDVVGSLANEVLLGDATIAENGLFSLRDGSHVVAKQTVVVAARSLAAQS